jgi:hypothetical protein
VIDTVQKLFALFVSKFNYSKHDFYALTPVDVNLILELKSDSESEYFNFFLNEFRTLNFYTVKSSFGDTKKFKNPSTLYELPFEKELKRISQLKAIEKSKQPLPDSDQQLLKKLGYL